VAIGTRTAIIILVGLQPFVIGVIIPARERTAGRSQPSVDV
jgi:hypothetical protein